MATVCSLYTANPRLQISDFLDNCDWCRDKARYTQPLDIGEWYVKCKRVPKPIWFNHQLLGRAYGASDYLTKDKWIYTRLYGWVYKLKVRDNHFYIHGHGWTYMDKGMMYSYKTKQWYSVKLFNKHELMSVE